ncbi:MAG: transposase [Verrucomicrobiae bacterium]|nr:transposase [Verrucomicrobiae bacterium]
MRRDELRFFNPWSDVATTRNRLPHWRQDGVVVFVTWRLADSIPKANLDRHHEEVTVWKSRHPEPWNEDTEREYHRLFSQKMDEWLDAGSGSCVLRSPANAQFVKDALLHFEGERTAMLSFVVMPNHVHGLFVLNADWRLEALIQSWKRYSAVRINRRENRTGNPLWQKDYFDRLVRDSRHFGNCVRYIRRNPEKARLRAGEFILWESELAREIE